VNLEGKEIPYGLKAKLGFTEHPEWEEELKNADSLEEVVKRFRRWAGKMPLVAHNARFDCGFLARVAERDNWNIENQIVDTMELACIARPDLSSFRLEELAKALGVGEGLTGGKLVEKWASEQGVGVFSWKGFHNAVVDVLVLAAIVPLLQEAIVNRMTEGGGESTHK